MSSDAAGGEVRRAVPDDAPGLVRVHLTCWRQAYGHLLSEEFLASREADVVRRAQAWRDGIARGNVPWLAESDGEVVGLALAVDPDAPGQERLDSHLADDQPPGLELAMLYLLESHHGSGLGQRLLDAAIGDGAALPLGGRGQPARPCLLLPQRLPLGRRAHAPSRASRTWPSSGWSVPERTPMGTSCAHRRTCTHPIVHRIRCGTAVVRGRP